MHILYIGFFGGAGCVARYLLASGVTQIFGRALPYGTLSVNVAGSFLLGLVMAFSLKSTLFSPEVRIGLTIGFMGGFTTFSTFSYETLRLLEEGCLGQAGLNILLNVVICLLATFAGVYIARFLA